MTKSLSERIAARTVKKPSRSGQNRAAFLALRADIRQALNDGWPVKSIWETLREEGKIDFSYQAFRNYANHLILSPTATKSLFQSTEKLPNPKEGNDLKQTTISKPTKKNPEQASGFTFNSAPKKEDLI